MSGRILIVDDTASNRVLLKAKLASAFYTVLMADSGAEALAVAASAEPDLVILDVQMPDIDGFEVCRRLKGDPVLGHVPVIMVTSMGTEAEKLRGLRAGADDFLSKPVSDVALFARVRNLLRMKMMFDELRLRSTTTRDMGILDLLPDPALPAEAEDDSSILVAAADTAVAGAWVSDISAQIRGRVRACRTLREAMDLAMETPPDAVVVDLVLGDKVDGRRLVSQLRARPETRQSAVILVVAQGEIEIAAQALDLGASDYIERPFETAELVTRLRSQLRRKHLSEKLRSNVREGLMMALVDPLTGLFNRRYATHHLGTLMARDDRPARAIAALMLDLDNFKGVNDRHGHAAGDEVLREFARRLQANVRGMDLVARLGGEEFLVAMPDVDAGLAQSVAERIREAVERPDFVLAEGAVRLSLTVSIGVSLAQPGDRDAAGLLRRADIALYASKTAGRNCVTCDCAA